nr:hypothetical protein [Janthinobacterium sp. 1_2014MBL_MicDiv]
MPLLSSPLVSRPRWPVISTSRTRSTSIFDKRPEQAVFTDQVLGFLLAGQQAVIQFEQFKAGPGPLVALCYGHYVSLIAAVSRA